MKLLVWKYFFAIIITLVIISCGGEPTNTTTTITYSQHIAPIIYKNCTPCHRPGEAGHFSLLSYADAKRWAKPMAAAVEKRMMPPWPADAGYTHFIDEKVLTEQEINLITTWANGEMLSGDTAQLPPLPIFYTGSYLGKPDTVIKMPKPIPLKGDRKDKFLITKVPFELPFDTLIQTIELVPGNRRLMHHLNGHVLRYEYEKKKNIYEGEYNINIEQVTDKQAYEKLGIANDDGSYPVLKTSAFNYLPGVTPTYYPDGIGSFRVNRKSAILIKDLHYGPSTTDTSDLSTFNIFYARSPLKRPTLELQLGTLGYSKIEPPLVIPPDTAMKFVTRFQAQVDMSVLTINPHMHLLGKSFHAYALTPKGDTIRLIRIPKWDFKWQYFYTFNNPVVIPAGSIIQVDGVFDNTVNNPFNPNHPPKTVSEKEGSMRTSDEMFQFIITYMIYKPGDEKISLQR